MLLAPARITSDLDTLRLNLGGQCREEIGHATLRKRGREQNSMCSCALGIHEPWQNIWLQSLEKLLDCFWLVYRGLVMHEKGIIGDTWAVTATPPKRRIFSSIGGLIHLL